MFYVEYVLTVLICSAAPYQNRWKTSYRISLLCLSWCDTFVVCKAFDKPPKKMLFVTMY